MANETLPRQTREEVKEELYRRFSDRGLRRQQRERWRQGVTISFSLLLLSGAKRMLDFVAAALLLTLLSPLMIAGWILTAGRLRREPRVGRYCETYDRLSFDASAGSPLARLGLRGLPVLFNILRGDMSFVGPRAAAPGDLSPRQRAARKRYNVRPGLICLWWVRRRANIAFDSEAASDAEYVETQSVWGDLGILARALPAVLYGEGLPNVAEIVRLLGIRMHNLTMSEAVEEIVAQLDGSGGNQVCFVNADCANIAWRDEAYRDILNQARMTLADGIGLKIAGKLLGREIKQNVNGTDMFPLLCAAIEKSGHGIFLLGARPGIADAVAAWIREHHPGVAISGLQHGYFTPEEEPAVLRRIADSGAALLLVAFGAPRQDKWIHRCLAGTGVKVAIGVGGLFDFYSGSIPRAPQWLREMGMEWLYRFWQEPRRMWRRYFVGNAVFLYRVMMERRGRQDGD
ncbi:MAG: WecB/TagA/CpsF family glycosyltransferase [Blastocatellia bacterium]|nr:WecB/TagA/CpsF family glycosyltransferase [Blastocatellia bacterium]